MAKKKSNSKSNKKGLIFNIIIIALAVLTICTLFMPMFISKSESAWMGVSGETGRITGMEVLTAMFRGEKSLDFSAGVNSMISLRQFDETALVTTIFSWAYLLVIVLAVVAIVFAVLSILKLKFKLLNTIFGMTLVVVAILAFIFGFVVASKFGNVQLGGLFSSKVVMSVAGYLALVGAVVGGVQLYFSRQK